MRMEVCMAKQKEEKWTLVQHSGFGYGQKPEFRAAVETREVTGKTLEKVKRAGGVLFDSYGEAEDASDRENYPPGTSGLVPNARGAFHTKLEVDQLRLYLPDPKLGLVRVGEVV
jgi:hypothetical protein